MSSESLARRLEESEAAHWASLMEGLAALPDNPYQPQVRRFGRLVALACPGMAKRYFVNRIFGAGDGDEESLQEAVAWMRSLGVPVRIDICPLLPHEMLVRQLAREGFCALGFQMALYGLVPPLQPMPAGVTLRPAETPADFAFVEEAMPAAFEETDSTWLRWLADSTRVTLARPDWRTYIGFVDGEPAGFGQLHMANGVGSLALAGTLKQFRGRGLQTALILRRIADAAAAGCDLIATQTGNGTASQRNMERLGLRVAYTKAEFYHRG
ncbi:MAG TPA: GNAT family N-acetyltransferase [Symbiobacteriaceae bacterium]|nr:GNAT family N-acetyltransferase [Symbiobacteriaceae bacterium]